MLLALRLLIIALYSIFVCVFGCLYCLLSPRNPRHVATFAHFFGRLAPIMGVHVELRKAPEAQNLGNALYIANHQNNYDMITVSNAVEPPTVTIGKKSLLWVPFFGQLYWLTGNLLINRENKSQARAIIHHVVNQFKNKRISFWMFPEGTRSRGRGILPFKTGAFHAAVEAKVPIVPIVVSSTDHIRLSRWNNGKVIVDILPPISVSGYTRAGVRDLTTYCETLMKRKFEALNAKIKNTEKEKTLF